MTLADQIRKFDELEANRTKGAWRIVDYTDDYGSQRSRIEAVIEGDDWPQDIVSTEGCGGSLADACHDTSYLLQAPAMYATIKALQAKLEWQRIETAPKDGIVIVVYNYGVDIGYWSSAYNGWLSGGSRALVSPTHWLPMPMPPEAEQV